MNNTAMTSEILVSSINPTLTGVKCNLVFFYLFAKNVLLGSGTTEIEGILRNAISTRYRNFPKLFHAKVG